MLAEEDSSMDEMIFQLEGLIGIGFSRIGRFSMEDGPYFIALKQQGAIALGDHYVLSSKKCNFLYVALSEINGFTLSAKFLHRKLFKNRNQDYLQQMQKYALKKYENTIYNYLKLERRQYRKRMEVILGHKIFNKDADPKKSKKKKIGIEHTSSSSDSKTDSSFECQK